MIAQRDMVELPTWPLTVRELEGGIGPGIDANLLPNGLIIKKYGNAVICP
tara:strand:+ start:101 stop:250 length:150 start_codon:yes stop_codon:yes gene_type:complete